MNEELLNLVDNIYLNVIAAHTRVRSEYVVVNPTNLIAMGLSLTDISVGMQVLRGQGVHCNHNLEEALELCAHRAARMALALHQRDRHLAFDLKPLTKIVTGDKTKELMDDATRLLGDCTEILSRYIQSTSHLRPGSPKPCYRRACFLFMRELITNDSPVFGAGTRVTPDTLSEALVRKFHYLDTTQIKVKPSELDDFSARTVEFVAHVMVNYDVPRLASADWVDAALVTEQTKRPFVMSTNPEKLEEFDNIIAAVKELGGPTDRNQSVGKPEIYLAGSQRLRPQLYILGYLMNVVMRKLLLECESPSQQTGIIDNVYPRLGG